MRTLFQMTTTQAEAVAKVKCGKRPLQESPPAMALAAWPPVSVNEGNYNGWENA
jgi:hypothetical protein